MDNSITTGSKTQGQFTIDYQQNGNGGCIPVIDGNPEPSLMFGYTSEDDKLGALNLIKEALRATNGNITQAKYYMMNAVTVAAHEIKPDEAVDIDGCEILLSYEAQKAYLGTEEVANLEDLDCNMPDEAVKALLISRATVEIKKRLEERLEWERDFDEDPYPYDDDEEDLD